jgi:hypothetical protein
MPDFPPLPFDRMNEADVREEVLAPLIRLLGYRTGTAFNVIRELSLRYPRIFLGRKDLRKDPELRGKADYIMEVQGRIRWVIEAKPPGVDMVTDDIEQAYSYASHSEVRAVYFVLCNGREIRVYLTQNAPNVGPILSLRYEQLDEKYPRLIDILGPEAIERDFPDRPSSTSPPIGPGLRSIVRVASGIIRYERTSPHDPALSQLQTAIVDGAVERDEKNRLVAFLRTQAPIRTLQEFNERMGLSDFEMVSNDSQLSIDLDRPTIFANSNTVVLPEGTELLDMRTWKQVLLPVSLRCDVVAIASGVLHENTFSGQFASVMQMRGPPAMNMRLEGEFFVRLA